MCARPAATGSRTSHCRVFATFCQPPTFCGTWIMETAIPCQTRRRSRHRVARNRYAGRNAQSAATAAGTLTGGLSPAARRRRNTGGRSLNRRPLGRQPPSGGPTAATKGGRGGPAPVSVSVATPAAAGARAAECAARLGPCRRAGGVVRGAGGWPPAAVGWPEKLFGRSRFGRDRRADPRKAVAGARPSVLSPKRLGPYLFRSARRPHGAAEDGTTRNPRGPKVAPRGFLPHTMARSTGRRAVPRKAVADGPEGRYALGGLPSGAL